MTSSSPRPILYDHFKKSAEVLLAEYERSKAQQSSDNIGLNRELFCTNFLTAVLPPRLSIRRGEIWDSTGNRTGQLEIVILRDDCPSLGFGQADSYLAEGVFAVIEIKSDLSRAKLVEALRTLCAVKSLRTGIEGASVTIGPVLRRPLRCIFAYEGATWETLLDELAKPENHDVADLICVLNRGALIARGHLLSWESDSPFEPCNGKSAALAWLYFHLVSYSAGFIGRALNILPYFEPLNGWADEGDGVRL